MVWGSMPARSTAARIAKAANVGPWVILSSPRPALVSGVRAVETITAWRVIAISVFKWVGLFLVSNIGGQFQQTQVVILRAKAGIAAQEFAVVKIGRASCRERGETSVEGIPIRKKGNKSVADVKVQ